MYDGSYFFTEHIVCDEPGNAFDIMAIDIVGNDERKDLVVTKIGDPGIHYRQQKSPLVPT